MGGKQTLSSSECTRDISDLWRGFCFSSGVNCTCWRRSAAPGWRSWRLWSQNTCRTASLWRRSWRKPSPCSPCAEPCWHTAATPNIPGTSCVSFRRRTMTWLRCAADHGSETDSQGLSKPHLSDVALTLSACEGGMSRSLTEPSSEGLWRENVVLLFDEMFQSRAHRCEESRSRTRSSRLLRFKYFGNVQTFHALKSAFFWGQAEHLLSFTVFRRLS